MSFYIDLLFFFCHFLNGSSKYDVTVLRGKDFFDDNIMAIVTQKVRVEWGLQNRLTVISDLRCKLNAAVMKPNQNLSYILKEERDFLS